MVNTNNIVLLHYSIIIGLFCFAVGKSNPAVVRHQLNDTTAVDVVDAAPTPFVSLPEPSELYSDCVFSTVKCISLLYTELQLQ